MAGPKSSGKPGKPSLFGLVVKITVGTFLFLVVSLSFSIISEWIGMAFFWPEKGTKHAEEMFIQELSYLQKDFKQTLLTSDTVEYSIKFMEKAQYYLLEKTGLSNIFETLAEQSAQGVVEEGDIVQSAFTQSKIYMDAAGITFKTFLVRLSILLLSMPLFVLCLFVGLTDGLIQRDVRRWCGGRESSLVFAYAKMFLAPSFIGCWGLYLAMPVSVHPNYILLPFALAFCLIMAITSSSFKKYL